MIGRLTPHRLFFAYPSRPGNRLTAAPGWNDNDYRRTSVPGGVMAHCCKHFDLPASAGMGEAPGCVGTIAGAHHSAAGVPAFVGYRSHHAAISLVPLDRQQVREMVGER
jgi:hypothetical protein